MRGTLLVLVLVGWLAIPTQAVINVTLTADDATLQPGETTRVRILAQGSDAGLAGLSGSITASGTAGLLSANADTFAWVAAFTSPEPFDSKLGTPGTNGGWSKFGSQQGSFLHPSPDFARASLTEVASYTVTAQPGSGSVTLSFVGAGVGGFVVLETDRTNVVGVFAPVSIIVSDPNAPVLGVSPAGGLDRSGTVGGPFSPAGVTYTLTNTSGGVLAWTVTKTQSWVSLSETSGTLAAGASDTVTVSIGTSADSLAIDTYSDTVTFTNTTNGIGNTTRPVSLTVTPPPGQLSISPTDSLDSSGTSGGPFSPANVTYTLSNPGGLPITWTAAKTQSWVSLSKTGGTLAAGASDTVTVSIGAGADSLAINTYSDTVTFTNVTNGSGNSTRAVSLAVIPTQGQFSVSPASGLNSVGAAGGPFDPASITYTLSNTGGTSIDWVAAKVQPWVSLSKTGGTLIAGGSDTVVVSIGAGADSLAIDTYSDTVTFTNTTNDSGTTNRGVSLSVILVGDVDNDGIVSILDVLRFVWVYGTSEGEAGFNPVCDLDRDGSVGMADLLILVSHFGETK